MPEFTKVCDSNEEKKEYGKAAVAQSNGTFYYVSTKGVNQDKYSYFHRTALTGGHVSSVIGGAGEMTKPIDFPAIDEDENREDVVFCIGDHLYMIVYSRYEKFEYRQVLRWTGEAWVKCNLKVEDGVAFDVQNRAEFVIVDGESGGQDVFAIVHNQTTRLHKIHFNSYDEIIISAIGSPIGADEIVGHHGWQPILAAHFNDTVSVIGGVSGCGFRWERDTILKININDGKAEVAKTKGDPPRWSYSGPRFSNSLAGAKWLMFGGSIAEGMTGSKKSNDVFTLDLDSYTWVKADVSMPDNMDSEYWCAAGDGRSTAYIHDGTNGVQKIVLVVF